MPTDSQRRNLASAHSSEVRDLNERIEALTKDRDLMEKYWNEVMATHRNIARLEAIEAAARNLVKAKTSYRAEQAFKALAAAITNTQEAQ